MFGKDFSILIRTFESHALIISKLTFQHIIWNQINTCKNVPHSRRHTGGWRRSPAHRKRGQGTAGQARACPFGRPRPPSAKARCLAPEDEIKKSYIKTRIMNSSILTQDKNTKKFKMTLHTVLTWGRIQTFSHQMRIRYISTKKSITIFSKITKKNVFF